MSKSVTIGIIGGSGLYVMEGLTNLDERSISTPFGDPSSPIKSGTLNGQNLLFLPRHGLGHRLSPTHINFRANIYALKQLGATHVISVSAVGSMKEHLHPRDVVIIDQFIDLTKHRASSFFEEGIAGHVSMADPVCGSLRDILVHAATTCTDRVVDGGTYLCMEGPQFSSRAESYLYRSWGVDVIGMTNATEAKLAREAGLCYATIAMVTDYDCWHEEEDDVTVSNVLENLQKNADLAKELIRNAVQNIEPKPCSCCDSARHAIITNPNAISSPIREKLNFLFS